MTQNHHALRKISMTSAASSMGRGFSISAASSFPSAWSKPTKAPLKIDGFKGVPQFWAWPSLFQRMTFFSRNWTISFGL